MMKIAIGTLTIILLFIASISFGAAPGSYYWIGGSGDWDDPSHWSKDPGGTPINDIPNDDIGAIFNNLSGLTAGSIVRIPPGSWAVYDFSVQTSSNFDILFDGTSGNAVDMNVFGDLTLLSSHTITYSGSLFYNEWNFLGNGQHNIATGGQDLLHVQFLDGNGEYNQIDDLYASSRIRMHGGEWNTNGFDVETDFLYFRDTNSSSNSITKVFNAGTSNITCDEFDSKLVYGSLTVTGMYSIYTNKFTGSPGTQIDSFSFHRIVLTQYNPFGTIEDNNFECRRCKVHSLIVQSTGLSRLADRFTITDTFRVEQDGALIEFNGGNGRENVVILDGQIVTPMNAACDERVTFTNAYTDYTTFIRSSGSVVVSDAIINNIQISGNGTFKHANSVLLGSSSGWIVSSPPISKTYYWIGNAGLSNWNDPANWELSNGTSNGCIPTYIDDVIVGSGAVGGIRIPQNYTAVCGSIKWTNSTGLELRLDGSISQRAELLVTGNFDLHSSAIVSGVNAHNLIFASNKLNFIRANGVNLPEITFEGELGYWQLFSDIQCESITFDGGTLDTKNRDVVTNSWRSTYSNDEKNYAFGSSHIIVNGGFDLQVFSYHLVNVNPGTSLIECENLEFWGDNLYDLKLNNPGSASLNAYPFTCHKLILGGNGPMSTTHDLVVDHLDFVVDGAELKLSSNHSLTVNESIDSDASSGVPAEIKSSQSGIQADLLHPFNLCATGYLMYQDINSDSPGVLNAPSGIDGGNNTNITFYQPPLIDTLFWIGRSGDWEVMSNWARVSGGCPETKNPDDGFHLVFDEHSFLPGDDTVTVSGYHDCGKIFFNQNVPATMMLIGTLDANNVEVNASSVEFAGNKLIVSNQFEVNGGTLEINLGSFRPEVLQVLSNSLFIVRGNAHALVSDLYENIGSTSVIETNGQLTAPFVDHISGTLTVSGLMKCTNNFYQNGTINVGNNGLIDVTGTFKNYSSITGNYLITGFLENYGTVTVQPGDSFVVKK